MKLINTVLVTFVVTLFSNCSSEKELHQRPIGLINNISYIDSSFNNPNASNGFLVTHEDNIYAITAKHVLMIAKTDAMKFVDFEGGLEQWKMHPKDDSTKYVVLDRLLNSNKKDSLTWSYMNKNWETYNDWLVFSVKENKTDRKPLKFRKEALQKGELLYAVGWSYKDTIGAQRFYEYKFDETEGDYHNLVQVKGPVSLGGLSGAPLIDVKGRVVGLVSSGWEDEKTKEVFLQATSIKNMVQFISELN